MKTDTCLEQHQLQSMQNNSFNSEMFDVSVAVLWIVQSEQQTILWNRNEPNVKQCESVDP